MLSEHRARMLPETLEKLFVFQVQYVTYTCDVCPSTVKVLMMYQYFDY